MVNKTILIFNNLSANEVHPYAADKLNIKTKVKIPMKFLDEIREYNDKLNHLYMYLGEIMILLHRNNRFSVLVNPFIPLLLNNRYADKASFLRKNI